MEPWLVAIVASVAFAGALLGLRRNRRTVARMLAAAGAAATADPPGAVVALRDEADRTAEELAAERHAHDLLLEW
ncbi:MAG TPA: hypothetical protein VIU37_09865, partial [Candidatus Limnocylindrales bacterium]